MACSIVYIMSTVTKSESVESFMSCNFTVVWYKKIFYEFAYIYYCRLSVKLREFHQNFVKVGENIQGIRANSWHLKTILGFSIYF